LCVIEDTTVAFRLHCGRWRGRWGVCGRDRWRGIAFADVRGSV